MSGTGNTTKVITATGDQTIDGVLLPLAWGDATITYSFSTNNSPYSYAGTGNEALPAGFNTISAAQETAAHRVLNTSGRC